ncbi:MAG: ATP-binding protein, partial [Desulfobacterota bacterium]|nr:ATP-binding protein [Thermodesulfobacteriota bacterium]
NRGDIIGFVAIGRDVTHEHMLEQRLRQAQKMEAIGTLAGGIAHDFNNILAAIIGYTELSCAHKNLEPGIRYNLEQILKASNRAADLVRQILAFSRKNMHEKRPVMLNTLLKESLQLLRATIPTTIEMRLELPPQPLTILADASQIHQVVMNLCTNAYQAIGDQQGTITVRLTDCEQAPADLAGYPDLQLGRYACLTVADNGPGITPEVIEHIFEPFFTTKPVDKGTGMGLAVVDGIVRTHHGAIRVTSQPGAGATFDIFFPLLEHPETECTASHEMVLKGNSEHILFVDDEATLVETGKQLLERLGYQVTATQSSSHALALIEENPGRFQVIITDQTMPGISGIELARKVKKINPELPVILCSGYSDVVTPEGAAAEGIEAFLYKPVDKHILAAALRTALEKTKSVNQKSGNGTVDA